MITLNSKIQLALEFALKKHHNQVRKLSDVPYSIHPISLAMLLIESNESEEVIISSLLHDLIEDTNTSYDELEKEFGIKVVNIVRACTEIDKSKPWEERKEHTIKIFHKHNKDIQMVILADKIHNLNAIKCSLQTKGSEIWNGFNRGYDSQKWYYSSLKKEFEESNLISDTKLLIVFNELFDIVFKK